MKRCMQCNCDYSDNKNHCVKCGSLLVAVDMPDPAQEEYDRIKREVTKKRRTRSLVISAIAIMVIVGVVSVAATLFDSNVDEVMQETGMSKERIEAIYEDAGAYMKSAQYDLAIESYKQVEGYKNAEKQISNAKEKYKESAVSAAEEFIGAAKYIEAIEMLNKTIEIIGSEPTEVSEMMQNAKTQYVEDILLEADQAMTAGDYTDAISILNVASEMIGEDAGLAAKLIEVSGNYKTSYIEQIKDRLSVGKYEEAVKLANVAKQIFPEEKEIAQLAYNANKSIALIKVAEYDAVGDVAGAIGYLNEKISDAGNDAELVARLEAYKEDYRTAVITQANDALTSSGHTAAISVVRGALGVLPGDDILISAIAEYETYAPVDLTTLNYYDRSDDGFLRDLSKTDAKYNTDILGNVHLIGFKASSYGKETEYQTYLVNGQYSKFTLSYFRSEYMKDYKSAVQLHILGDGAVLYSSQVNDKGFMGEDIEVDITGITQLTIQQSSNAAGHVNCCTIIANPQLWK